MTTLGVIIGGTPPNLALEVVQSDVQTPWGQASSPLYRLQHAGASDIVILKRHGADHALAPHQVNYRANLWAMRQFGVEEVLSTNTVGGIDRQLNVGQLVLPDQLIDYTWGRASTYDDRRRHVDFSNPYDRALQKRILALAPHVHHGGIYGCTQGPRLETAAEIQRLARDGCTVVGMTGMPEAGLARELDLPYVSLCVVVNPAAGLGPDVIDMD